MSNIISGVLLPSYNQDTCLQVSKKANKDGKFTNYADMPF